MKKLIILSFLSLFLTNSLCSQTEIDTTVERFLFDTTGFHEMFQEQKKRDQEKYEAFQKNRIDSLSTPHKSKGIENVFGSKQSNIQRDTSMLDSNHYNYDFNYLYDSDENDIEDTIEYDTTPPNRYYQSKTINSFDLYFGSKVFNSSFYNSFNVIDHVRFNSPIYEIGFGFSGQLAVGSTSSYDNIVYEGHFSYHAILPIIIAVNDTIHFSTTGSTISFGFGRDLYYSLSNFDLIVSGGIDLGRLMLSNPNYKYMKNPFFNPTISVQPKVKIKHFVISLRVDAWNDISNARWKQALVTRFSGRQTYDLTNYRQSGMRFLVGIGYSIK